jgi:hypothetical protein
MGRCGYIRNWKVVTSRILEGKRWRRGSVEPCKGIDKARSMDSDATIHVERVRDIGPGRDKWRRI